jgi:shikimate dehydrogenase
VLRQRLKRGGYPCAKKTCNQLRQEEDAEMKIDLNTKMITLIGKPLGFSFAARMQNAAYETAGLNMLYFYTELGSEHLEVVLNGIRHMNFAGAAITKPNKVEVLKYLDEIDDLCEKMGSCNTIVKTESGKLKGYNTDGMGFYISLREETNINLNESAFFCFGAGGAGRAICSTIAYYGAKKIYITDKLEDTGRSLVSDINKNFADIAEYVQSSEQSKVYEKIAASDVVINATGVGTFPKINETPVSKDALNSRQLCFDAAYNPTKTLFLAEAEKVGCKIMNGIGMTIQQGGAQIKLWTGQEAPLKAMRKEVETIIKEWQ